MSFLVIRSRVLLKITFRPFDRLGAEQSEVQGTGMGLALSKGPMGAA